MDIDTLLKEIGELEQDIQDLSQIYAQEADIHKYTHQIGKYYSAFQSAFDKYYDYLPLEIEDLNTVIKDIDETMAQSDYSDIQKTQIQTVLHTIQNTPSIDAETGASIQSLLVQTWALRYADPSAIDLILYNLNQNIAAGGGCVAGIAAGLIQPYTNFLLSALHQLANQHTISAANQEVLEQDFLNLQYHEVLAYSQLMSPQTGGYLHDDDDPALAEAIQHSLKP